MKRPRKGRLALLAAHAALVTRARPGVAPGQSLPRLSRSVDGLVADAEWLAAYAQIVGWPLGAALPPLAPQVLAMDLHLALLADHAFPLRALGLVHVANTTEELAVIEAGQPLDLSAFIAGSREVARGVELDLVTEARVAGQLVSRSTTIALSRRGASRATPRSSGNAPTDTSVPDDGVALRSTIERVPEDLGRRYARLAGDLNPIHQRAWMAKLFGFPCAIVHGMWTLGRALAHYADTLPPIPRRIDVRFRKPVALPSSIALRGFSLDSGALRVVVSPPEGGTPHLEIDVQRVDPAERPTAREGVD